MTGKALHLEVTEKDLVGTIDEQVTRPCFNIPQLICAAAMELMLKRGSNRLPHTRAPLHQSHATHKHEPNVQAKPNFRSFLCHRACNSRTPRLLPYTPHQHYINRQPINPSHKMPRQSRGPAPAPRRPTAPAPAPRQPAPQQTRQASTAAVPQQRAAPPAQQQAPPTAGSQGPGLFGQMASTAAYAPFPHTPFPSPS